MIEDGQRRADLADLQGDVCVVGGGPAGISIAMTLASSGCRVILLESGGTRETEAARDLNRGYADPPGCHEPLEENRRRRLGGASGVWGGRCVPLDDVDFMHRPWVDNSGWPITRADLEPYYAQALSLCEAGSNSFAAVDALPGSPAEMVAGLDGDGVTTQPIERWSPPTDFGRRYRGALVRNPYLRVVLHATARHVQADPNGRHVEHVVVSLPGGRSAKVTARYYVLAAGSLENTRLLLASDDVISGGIGGHSDALGRYYMTHLFGNQAVTRLDVPPARVVVGFERDGDGVYCRRRMWLTPEVQAKEGLLNTVFFWTRAPSGATGHRDALFSTVYVAKTVANVLQAPSRSADLVRGQRHELRLHAGIVARNLPDLAPQAARIAIGRYLTARRLPMVLPTAADQALSLYFQAEQVPHRGSRVRLADSTDLTGLRRLVVTPRATSADLDSVVRSHRILARRFAESGVGSLDYQEEDLRDAVLASTTSVNSAAHHLGTTRMSSDPATGVVDSHCGVHGVHNLFVAGASVFPTGGHANPTLTVLALALRLAAHLKTRLPGVTAD